MKKLNQSIFLIAVCAALTLASCKKDVVNNTLNSNSSSEAPITNVNGILRFKDQKTFDITVDALSKQNQKEATAWENQYNFVSQRTLFNRIVDAEIAYDVAARKLSAEDAAKLRDHSELYYKYLSSGLIKEIEDTYNYSIYCGTYATVVNEKGLVIIGKEICQLTSAGVRKITNGDFSKLSLLFSATKTDEANNIVVRNVKVVNRKIRGDFDFSEYGKYDNGSRRVEIWLSFISNLDGGGSVCYVHHNVNVQTREKNWRGQWNLQATWTDINGSWTVAQRLISGGTTFTYPTFHYLNLINNFWASVNILDGNTAPYESFFIYYAPSGNNYWFEYQLLSVHWWATAFNSQTAHLYH